MALSSYPSSARSLVLGMLVVSVWAQFACAQSAPWAIADVASAESSATAMEVSKPTPGPAAVPPGQVRWTLDGTWGYAAPVRRNDGSVVVASSEWVRAIDAQGIELWATNLPGVYMEGLAATPDGRLLVVDNARLYCLDGDDGTVRWQVGGVRPSRNAPAVGESGEVYLADLGNTALSKVSPEGTVLWRVTLPWENVHESGYTHPAIGADGTLYAIHQQRIYALDPADGAVRWRTDPIIGLHRDSLALAPDDSVLVTSSTESGSLHAYGPDGARRWTSGVPTIGGRMAVLADGTILVPGGATAPVHVFGPDGAKRGEISFASWFDSMAADNDGTVYVGQQFGLVQALDPLGIELWQSANSGMRVWRGGDASLLVFNYTTNRLISIATATLPSAGVWQPQVGDGANSRRAPHSRPRAPTIRAAPPARLVVAEGARLELTVIADGTPPLAYEWRHDGVVLPDARTNQYMVKRSTPAEAGVYTVTITNAGGAIASTPLTISITPPVFGSVMWTSTLEPLVAPAIGDDGTIFTMVSALDPASSVSKIWLLALDGDGFERWRREIPPPGYVYQQPPVIGDDGTVFVPSHNFVTAFAADGTLRWQRDLNAASSSNSPALALGPGRSLYVMSQHTLALLDDDGTTRWTRTHSQVSVDRILVRRDGVVCYRDGAPVLVRPDGPATVVDPHPAGGYGYPGLIGPDDTLVTGFWGDGSSTTYDRDGHVLSADTSNLSNEAAIMLETGYMVGPGGGVIIPYRGIGSNGIGVSGEVISALQGNRFLLVTDTEALVYADRGEFINRARIAGHRNYTLGRNGRLVGGRPLTAYHVPWAVAASPWPQPRADPRHTARAPSAYVLAMEPPREAVTLGRREAGWLEENPDFPVYFDNDVPGYAGYWSRLIAIIDATGPLTLQWQKDGADVPGATGRILQLEDVQATDAGEYTLLVTNPRGTITSEVLRFNVVPPSSATPGTWVGYFEMIDGFVLRPVVLTVRADRTYDVADLSGGGGGFGNGRLSPQGELEIRGSAAGYAGDALVSLYGHPVVSLAPRLFGTAPNGLPAGVYRGRTVGDSPWRVTFVVLNDGSFHCGVGNLFGAAWTDTGAFVGSALTTTIDMSHYVPLGTVELEARPDGAIVGRVVELAPGTGDMLAFESFGVTALLRPAIERLANLSTRGYVSADQPPLIAGFVAGDATSQPVLLRAVGPELARHGVGTPLARPRLRLLASGGAERARNAGWGLGASEAVDAIRDATARLTGLPLSEGGDDAALYTSLENGAWSMAIDAVDGEPGVVLAEVYPDSDSTSGAGGRLRNLSTRGTLGRGERVLIGGFFVDGELPKTLFLRVAGPALAPFVDGAFTVASDPQLEIYRTSDNHLIASNDDWQDAPLAYEFPGIEKQTGAFAYPVASKDAALLIVLPPGGYTVVARNAGTDEGVGLLEIYEVPAE